MPDPLMRTPVYQQLNQLLRRLIGSPEFPAGARFITERDVAERFQVSRPTANKALSSLVAEGLLEFRKGMGTYVRAGMIASDLQSLVSFTAKALAAGKTPATTVLSLRGCMAAEAGEEVPGALDVDPEDQVLLLERLRLLDAVPVIIERRWVPMALMPGITAEDLGGSFYTLVTERFRHTVAGATQSIGAINLDAHDAALLAVDPGLAGLEVRVTGHLDTGRILWWERTLYRADAWTFVNRLGRVPGHGGNPGGALLTA